MDYFARDDLAASSSTEKAVDLVCVGLFMYRRTELWVTTVVYGMCDRVV